MARPRQRGSYTRRSLHQGLLRVISGGQSGVDRAALDAALASGVMTGGWCPRGRWAEDGSIEPIYGLQETPLARVLQRTQRNVRDSDGTLVLVRERPRGGTLQTIRFAAGRRPCLVLDPTAPNALARARAFIARHRIECLNVAGPRASEATEIYSVARTFIANLLSRAALRR